MFSRRLGVQPLLSAGSRVEKDYNCRRDFRKWPLTYGKSLQLPEYYSSPGTNHHSCENWVQAVQPIYLVPAHLWYSDRGAGIYNGNRRTRQKVPCEGLQASMHDVTSRRLIDR